MRTQRLTGKFNILILAAMFLLAGVFVMLAPADACAQSTSVKVFGDGVENEVTFSVNELWQWKTDRPEDWVGPRVYSTINTWPTKKWYAVEGVKLSALLEEAQIKHEAQSIKVKAIDGYVMTFTKKELLEDTRYYFPGLKENHEFWGQVPGSPEGAEPVEAIIALRSVENSDNPDYMTPLNCPLLVLGQRGVTEQTNHTFVKDVAQIEVSCNPPLKWAAPQASVPEGTVPAGTEVELTNEFNDADKIYYTLDGSAPNVWDSPIYNWIASRWWSSREDVLEEINHPIVITENTTIKAVTIGFGREDSEIVTFTYEVEIVNVSDVSISEGDQEVEEGGTVQLTAVVEPENATDKSVTWSSSNEAVATVDANGLVTAVAAGKATITVTTTDGGFTDSVEVTVVSKVVPVTGVSISEGDQELEVGETVQLTAVVEPENATDKSVTWSSSDEAVATVDANGLVTAVAAGEATITVTTTDGGFTDSITVTVAPLSDFVVQDGVLVEYRGAGGDVVIPGDLGITKIGSMVFAYLPNLTSVVIPEGVTIIDGIAFEGCSNLTSVVIPESVNTIGACAFAECHKLTQINIPEAVTSIEPETFYRCYALANITLPSGITSIGTEAFMQCSSLSEISIPDAVTSIGKNAFRSCSALTEIVIPGNVTSIGDSAFYKCANLTSVTILSRDATFGNGVFNNSPNVTIYAFSGSTAETYADDNAIPFVALDAKPHIVSITPVDDVEVPYGTTEAEAIAALAAETTITDSDEATHNVTLNWVIADYDSNTAGDYTATGTFELPEGVEQSDPPLELKVTATVTVSKKPIPLTVVVKEDGVETRTIEYDISEWEAVERQYYSVRDSLPAYRLGAAEGVFLTDLLDDAEIDVDSVTDLTFNSSDGYGMTLSKSVLLDEPRYYYPNIFSDNQEEGAVEVEPMLALKSYVGARNSSDLPSWDMIDDLNTIRLFVGQVHPDDINYGMFVKWICELEVEPDTTVPVTGVSISEGDQELVEGGTVQLTAVVEPENATDKSVTWSSSDEAVATVDANGLVTAVAAGTATITVTTNDGNFTDSINVNVMKETPHIVSITPVDDVEVPYGTTEADAIAALASETTITDSDDVIHTVALNWSIADYDGNTAGDYTATGTFALPEGVEQSDPPMPLEVTATVTVLPQVKYALTLAVDPAAGGTVTGAGEYAAGESVTVEAQAAEGYTFVSWTDDEGEVSTATSYTFTMPAQAVNLTANFRALAASQYAFDYDVPGQIVEGQDVQAAVTFHSVEIRDLGYDGMRFKFNADGPGDVTFSATDSNGVEHTFTNEGYWGPAGGFDLPAQYSATTDWTLNFAQAGVYTVTFSLVDAATEEVIAGITDSVEITVVTDDAKAELRAKVNQALELDEGNYTPNSWRNLENSLRIAQVLLNLENAPQASIDQSLARLNAAMEQLAKTADKTALEAAINEAKALNPADYTARSWRQVSNMLLVAERVFHNANAEQEEVDQAEERLNNALNALTRVK